MDNRCLVILNTEVRFVMKGKDEIWMDTGEGKKKRIRREPVLFLSVLGAWLSLGSFVFVWISVCSCFESLLTHCQDKHYNILFHYSAQCWLSSALKLPRHNTQLNK